MGDATVIDFYGSYHVNCVGDKRVSGNTGREILIAQEAELYKSESSRATNELVARLPRTKRLEDC